MENAGRSGIASQFVVLTSGVMIALLAFWILSVFIKDMVAEDFRETVTGAQETISRTIFEMKHDVRNAANVLGMSKDMNDQETRARVLASLPPDHKFEKFYWIRRNASGNWGLTELVNLRGNQILPDFDLNNESAIVNHILSNRPRSPYEGYVVIDIPGVRARQETLDPLVEGRLIAFARTVVIDNLDAGVVFGLARTSSFLGDKWIANNKGIIKLGISDQSYGLLVYFMDRLFRGDRVRENFFPNWTFELEVGRRTWLLQAEVGKSGHIRFLEKMPWLMLLFGFTLTVIGTLYVRNNHSQSAKLTAMNRALAQKNYALNSEVAERERLNQVLRKAEREYRAIVDSVSDIIFEASTKGEIVFLNDTWERISGFKTDQIVGRVLFDLFHPQDQEEQRSNFDDLVKGKRNAYRAFTRLRTSDGSFRSVELAVSMLRQDENRNLHVVGTLTDVEERRRAERALSEAEKKYRQIVENAAGGIYQVTPEGQFLSANKAMAQVLGYETPEQMLRSVKNAHDIYVSSKERGRFIRELETVGVVNNFEIQAYTRENRKIWVNENARAVKDDEGNIMYFEGSLEDVTQRKEAELKLREAKVQSDLANRAKSEFLANMSHELRTPLNAIIGFSEIIKDEVLGPVANKQYWEYSRDIYDSGKRLLTIINEILDVSRIEAGERQLNEGIVNTGRIVKSCIDFMMPKAEANNMSITNMMENTVPHIVGEELAVKQVLLNLLSNAVKYTPHGGRVTLSHEIDARGQLRISVTDTGVGLDENEIQKALSPFGQVDTALNREGSGAGLGLTLVESLMKMHGGALELFSQKGIGTTATVIFPAKRVAQDPANIAGDSGDQSAADDAADDDGVEEYYDPAEISTDTEVSAEPASSEEDDNFADIEKIFHKE